MDQVSAFFMLKLLINNLFYNCMFYFCILIDYLL